MKDLNRLISKFWIIIAIFALVSFTGCNDDKTNVNSALVQAPVGSLQGFVKDYKTNAPISGVVIALYAGAAPITTTTGADGHWYFSNVRADDDATSLVYAISHPDGTYLPMVGMTNISEVVDGSSAVQGQTNGLTTVLDYMVSTVTVTGFVQDAGTGLGINGASVFVAGFGTNLTTGGNQFTPTGGTASVSIDSTTLTATTAARTEGGDGYYTIAGVPALNIFTLGNFGAYASGYEYNIATDSSSLNLQYATTARVDFDLSVVDNTLGLVSAQITPVSDLAAQNIMIMRDATGAATNLDIAKIDMYNSSTTGGVSQLVFTLIFDQAINATLFENDTIQLKQGAEIVNPAFTTSWTNAYTVVLTGTVGLSNDILSDPYELTTKRVINAASGVNTIAAGVVLAQFQAYDSSYDDHAASPTPGLFLTDDDDLDDAYLVAHNGLYLYDTDRDNGAPVNPDYVTLSQYYDGFTDRVIKSNILLAATVTGAPNAYNTVDLYIDEAQASPLTTNDYQIWTRQLNRDGVVIEGLDWEEASSTPTYFDGKIVFLDVVTTPVVNALRYGTSIQYAITTKSSLGVDAIIGTNVLTIADTKSPELIDYAAGTTYALAEIEFNEPMGSTVSLTGGNSNIFTLAPAMEFDEDTATTLMNAKLNPAPYTLASVTDPTPTAVTTAMNYVLDGSRTLVHLAGLNPGVCVDQYLKFKYSTLTDGVQDVEVRQVAGIVRSTVNNDIVITLSAALTGDLDQSVAIVVDPLTTTLRSGATEAVNITTALTTVTLTGANMDTIAAGDVLIYRDTRVNNADASIPYADINITVTSVTAATPGSCTINFAATGTTNVRDLLIYKGDMITAVASDEAGNAMHSDADSIVIDANGQFPLLGAAAGNVIF